MTVDQNEKVREATEDFLKALEFRDAARDRLIEAQYVAHGSDEDYRAAKAALAALLADAG
jgi:hypothetical protein